MRTATYALLLTCLMTALVIPFAHAQQTPDQRPFITTWHTYDANQTIIIPLVGSNMTIHWGDGASSAGVAGTAAHRYANPGTYTVSVYGGLEAISLGGHPGASNLVSIEQWGDTSWTSMAEAFRGVSNMVYRATDTPNLNRVTNMSGMFRHADSFNGDLSTWDVSAVTDMSYMFWSADSFNGNISTWDVSSVTDMGGMFGVAFSFNGNISTWDVSSVTDMHFMFSSASSFNQPLSTWDVSSVTDMGGMFHRAHSFNQDISTWDVSSVIYMHRMFDDATYFNQDISAWDVFSVIYMSNMFRDAISFNQDISSWDISSVTTTTDMFQGAGSFNQDIHAWDMVRAQQDQRPFVITWKVDDFHQTITMPLSGNNITIFWGDGAYDNTELGVHQYEYPGTYTISIYGNLESISFHDSPDASKLMSIEQWGDASWTSMADAFRGASNMAYRATDIPNLNHVANMSGMFRDAASFNGDLSTWDVSSVTDMSYMFWSADSFNGNISTWDVSSVTDMFGMFAGASSFNGNISAWDVSAVTDMSGMFQGATSFNGNISTWDVSSVTDMHGMFAYVRSFNQSISTWDVSAVTDMSGMFWDADFNGDLSTWDVSAVTDMRYMFRGATTFNQPLDSWNVSAVTDMSGMFQNATSFDQNLGNWYVVIDSASIDRADIPGAVGAISTQNTFLDGQSPTYRIDPGGDSDRFEIIDGNILRIVSAADQEYYMVTIVATGDSVFEDGNNRRTIQVTLVG